MGVDAVTPDARDSRAAARAIEAGNSAMCAHCREQIKFQSKVRLQQVICNVYEDGRWLRVEHYHEACYTEAGEPYGPAAEFVPTRRRAASPSPEATS